MCPKRRGAILTMRPCSPLFKLLKFNFLFRLQTPVYALYQVPTIVSAAILLTTRHIGIPLPSEPPICWWELFDAEWEDVWSVSGYIMRLYRQRTEEETVRPMGLVSKKDVRKWIEKNARTNTSEP